jgi:hypothetical protein
MYCVAYTRRHGESRCADELPANPASRPAGRAERTRGAADPTRRLETSRTIATAVPVLSLLVSPRISALLRPAASEQPLSPRR